MTRRIFALNGFGRKAENMNSIFNDFLKTNLMQIGGIVDPYRGKYPRYQLLEHFTATLLFVGSHRGARTPDATCDDA